MKFSAIEKKLKKTVDQDFSYLSREGCTTEDFFEVVHIHQYGSLEDYKEKIYRPIKDFYENLYLDFESEGTHEVITWAEVYIEDFKEWMKTANPDAYYRFGFECGNDNGAEEYELELIGVNGDYVLFKKKDLW